MKPTVLKEYLREDGRSPFGDWLRSLRDARARARVRIRLDRLKLGNPGDCKSVGSGVQELRIDYGPGYRIYCGLDGAYLVLLLFGGDKRTQRQDIRTAMRYWEDYRGRTR